MAENNNSATYTEDTFLAFVDAVIPRTPNLAQVYGNVMYYGALDFQTNDYIIMDLNYFYIPLADVMAKLLDLLAYQLKNFDSKERIVNFQNFNQRGLFLALKPEERFQALLMAEHSGIYFSVLLLQFQEYPGLLIMITSLVRFTQMGYYSEWFGYGSTRLEDPSDRVLQFHPLSWEQIGYPGPSFTYIAAVRNYYAIKESRNKT